MIIPKTSSHFPVEIKVIIISHRKIMEDKLGRKLTSIEIVHHINGDHEDNRIENLYLCEDQHEHSLIHNGTTLEKWLKECREQTFRNANRYLSHVKRPFKLEDRNIYINE